METLSQILEADFVNLIREGGIVAALAWFVWYFQHKWETVDKRHEELHEKTLQIVSLNTAAISQMTLEMHSMKKDLRLCQIVRSGDFEAMKKAIDESD